MDYEKLLGALTGYHHDHTVLVDTAGTNWAIYTALQSNPCFTLAEGCDPVQALKSRQELHRGSKISRPPTLKTAWPWFAFHVARIQLAIGAPLTEVDVEQKLPWNCGGRPGS